MRRRGARDSVVSLFAFQDVMASVIGVLFFVVLLMSMYITETGPGKVDRRRRDPAEELRRAVYRAKHELADVQRSVRRSAETASLLVKDDTEIAASIRELNEWLKSLLRTVEAKKNATSKAEQDAQSMVQSVAEEEKTLVLLRQRVAQAQADIDRVDKTPRLSYIIGEDPGRLEPWLVDLTDKTITVGSKDGSKTVMTFRASTQDKRVEQFQAWAKLQNPRTHYFVLLIRPSSADFCAKVAVFLKDAGFHLGTDLLPEDWQVME